MSLDLKDEDSVINRVQSGFKPNTEERTLTNLEQLQLQKLEILQNQSKLNLLEIFQKNATRPINVRNIVVEGTEQFRDSFITAQIKPLLESKNFNDLLKSVDSVNLNFQKLGVLQNPLQIQLHSLPNYKTFGSLDIQPMLKLTPAKKFFAKTGTNIGNGEGDGYMTFQWRNIFGGGESLMLDATTGTRTKSSYLLNYSTPLFNNAGWKVDTSVFSNSRKIDWTSHEQSIVGINNKIISVNEGFINHEFSIENIIRSVHSVDSKNASNNVLFHAGEDFKSSFIYKFNYDSRDDKILPTHGSSLIINNEISGLSKYNTSSFIKQSVESSFAYTLSDRFSEIVNFSLRGGWLYSFNKPSHLMDRFYIGGPNDVRSFFFNGLGPRNFNDTLGGDIYLSGGLSHFHKLPFISKDSSFKLHQFVNFGRLIPFEKDQPLQSTVKQLFEQPSIGFGFGLVFKHSLARFELNFVLPLTAHENDSMRKGLQYGIGLSFM
jgi:outer membrane protein insertion porin family